MEKFEQYMRGFSADAMKAHMQEKYANVIRLAKEYGVYIWGCGKLGEFVYEQCKKNKINVKGFIDNDINKINANNNVYSCDVLKKDDVIIIASIYYPNIIQQLKTINRNNYIYYEEFAVILEEFDIYYQMFNGNFEEIEKNVEKYIEVYSILADDTSREIYENVMLYKMTMDVNYTEKACELSMIHGREDFDDMIVSRLNGANSVFYDVGGYDGGSTKDFIDCVKKYDRIFYFEPDKNLLELARKNLGNENKITFVQAIVGEKKGKENYNSVGDGSGYVAVGGTETVEVCALDDYMTNNYSYIKMDIEGYEMNALLGAKEFISHKKPILSISVYHKPGDIHQIVNYVLSLNPRYKVYARHYTRCYTDTRFIFIDDEVCK